MIVYKSYPLYQWLPKNKDLCLVGQAFQIVLGNVRLGPFSIEAKTIMFAGSLINISTQAQFCKDIKFEEFYRKNE